MQEDLQTPPHPRDEGRRNARFTYAKRRIEKIIDGAPPLTAAQRADLAALLAPATGEEAA